MRGLGIGQFKRIVIANCKIKEFKLYEPFKSLYEGRGIRWEVTENQRVMENPGCVSTYARSDGRCPPYRRTMASLAEALTGE